MYKRKKRRANKGKKKLSIATSPSSLTPTSWADEKKVAGAADTSDNMSVTTMEVAENHHQKPQRQTVELVASNNNSNSKAVGARKRKPMQISKIVDKMPSMTDHPVDFGAEKNLVLHNNNNNSPPYKKPCLEMSKNGMIKNILSELKTAKLGSSRSDSIYSSKHIERDEDDEDDRSDEEGALCMKEDGDDESEEGVDYSGNEEARFLNKRQTLYVSSTTKERYGAGIGRSSAGSHHREGPSRDKTDLTDIKIKSILVSSGVTGETRSSSPNGWDRKYMDEDDSANDEGADLRSITGNSTGDDELPFRCGVCAYGSCDKSTLLRHMRTHSGERPFQCRLCYFAFTTKANCERHLRNRHGQIDRDQLRNLVVCLPTSSNASESETEVNSNGGRAHQLSPVASLDLKVKRTSQETSAVEENEMPLDLSMDAVDLSTKNRDGNSNFRRKASLPRPRPLYASSEMSNSLVTSPFICKREPLVHPQLPLNTFTSHPIAQTAPIVGAHPTHPAFSIFPFGAPSGYNPFAIPSANVEKLIGLGSSSPPKMTNPFIAGSPNSSFENREGISAVEKDVKVKQEPISESKRSGSNSKSTSSSSVSPTTSSRKRSDNSNGEYQKPKQRRYRTERPFACPHCPARFTLRSNMERHGKHQHPTVWQRSPSNRVINRQKNQQMSPLVGPPTLVHPNKYTGNNIGADIKVEKNRDASVNVRAVIAQQLKRKLSNSSLRNNNNGSETETDPENTPGLDGKASGGDTPDLASVSQLLDRVKNSNFAQYFNEAEGHSMNDNNQSDDDGEGEGDESAEEALSSEEGEMKSSGVEKKKSAYSSAPHKISCPHCTRRFPWTSSLRRHLLTHTGQKPFQCSKCPLLFTTKSNCDRHLARKHSDSNTKGASDSNNSSEDEDGDGDGEEDNYEDQANADEEGAEPVTPNTSNSSTQSVVSKTPANGSHNSSPGEDAAFRCHLCEAAAGEREALLAHMEEQHKDTFHLLVSKGALSSSPPSENSENEQNPIDVKDVTHRKVMCVFCIRRFWSVEDLRRHIRSHSGERPFSCPHCSRRFTLKHSMLRHLKKHSSSSTPSRKMSKVAKETGSAANIVTSAVNSKNGDLIGRLLGLNDDQLVEQLLSQPDAKDAAKLLGLGQQQQMQSTPRVTSKVN